MMNYDDFDYATDLMDIWARGQESDKLDSVPIIIQDAIMGAGKTTAMINKLNEVSKKPMKNGFLVILPYLSEIERYKEGCPGMNFQSPETAKEGSKTKREDFLKLIEARDNILTTHALLDSWDDEMAMLVHEAKYHIIMDGEVRSMEGLKVRLNPGERKELIALEYLTVDAETREVTWDFMKSDDPDGKYTGVSKFAILRRHCKKGSVYLYGELDSNSAPFFVSTLPAGFFKVGISYEILTYRFESSDLSYFFKISGLDYIVEHPEPERQNEIKAAAASLITFIDAPKSVKAVCDVDFSLSHSWFAKCKPEVMAKIGDSLGGSLKKTHKVTPDKLLWTCLKTYSTPQGESLKGRVKRGCIAPQRYAGIHVHWTCKGTNAHADKDTVLYLMNLYPQVGIVKHISNQGYSVVQDEWALNHLLQFIWRSSIRDGKPIKVMIPSKRMKDLLEGWIDPDKRRITRRRRTKKPIEA